VIALAQMMVRRPFEFAGLLYFLVAQRPIFRVDRESRKGGRRAGVFHAMANYREVFSRFFQNFKVPSYCWGPVLNERNDVTISKMSWNCWRDQNGSSVSVNRSRLANDREYQSYGVSPPS